MNKEHFTSQLHSLIQQEVGNNGYCILDEGIQYDSVLDFAVNMLVQRGYELAEELAEAQFTDAAYSVEEMMVHVTPYVEELPDDDSFEPDPWLEDIMKYDNQYITNGRYSGDFIDGEG